jgi:hypothetical protein
MLFQRNLLNRREGGGRNFGGYSGCGNGVPSLGEFSAVGRIRDQLRCGGEEVKHSGP